MQISLGKMMEQAKKREQQLATLKKTLVAQEAENREFFDRIGLSPLELLQLFQDETRFPADIWQKIQQERRRIEARLDSKIQECNSKPKSKEPSTSSSEVKGHWIFLK